MRFDRVGFATVTAVALALASVSASGQTPAGEARAIPAAATESAAKPAPSVSGSTFATLARVKAVPMSAGELDAVKGQHIHFVTPSRNVLEGEEGLHLVNRNNTSNWIDFGTGPAGPGYHGLCGAALNSPALFIPGQSTTTGTGAGC